MSVLTNTKNGTSLSEVYPPFASKMAEFCRLVETDEKASAVVFEEASGIAKAFWAGAAYARARP